MSVSARNDAAEVGIRGGLGGEVVDDGRDGEWKPLSRTCWHRADGLVQDGLLRVYDVNPPVNEKPVLEYNLYTGKYHHQSSFRISTDYHRVCV